MNIFTQLFFSGIEVNTFTSDSLHSIKELLFKTQYYIFLAFSRQNSLLPWQPTNILSGSSSYFDLYLKGYTCYLSEKIHEVLSEGKYFKAVITIFTLLISVF